MWRWFHDNSRRIWKLQEDRLSWAYRTERRLLNWLIPTLLTGLKIWVVLFGVLTVLLVMFAVAASFYAMLYAILVPDLQHSLPVYFNFSDHADPIAEVNLDNPEWLYVPNYSDSVPRSDLAFAFEKTSSYDMELVMSLPDSEVNHNLGMVMVEIEVYHRTRRGANLVASSARPFLPSSTSSTVRRARQWLFMAPLVLGLINEKDTAISIRFGDFFENPHVPTSFLIIRLAGDSRVRKFQLYSSELLLHAHLTGFRYVMYHWFWTSAFIFTAVIFAVELFFAALILLIVYSQFTYQPETGIGSKHSQFPSRPGEEDSMEEEQYSSLARMEARNYDHDIPSANDSPSAPKSELLPGKQVQVKPESRAEEDKLKGLEQESKEVILKRGDTFEDFYQHPALEPQQVEQNVLRRRMGSSNDAL